MEPKRDNRIKPGEVRNPHGRPVGSKNKKDVFIEAVQKQAIEGGILPLDFMLTMLRNDGLPLGVRFECAKAAAPYCHRKMPVAVEITSDQFKVFDPTQLQGLSLEEMQTMAKLLRKAHDAEMDAFNGGVTVDGTAQRVADAVHAIDSGQALTPLQTRALALRHEQKPFVAPKDKPKPKPLPRPKPWEK